MNSDVLSKLFDSEVPEYLTKLLMITKKSKLKKYCRDITIFQEDFVKLIVNSDKIRYTHQRKYHDFIPSHLHPTDEERSALTSATVGERLEGGAKKFINKIKQIFEQRRYLVAHVFFNRERWHLFYFDQKDMGYMIKNHWKEGMHIHFVNYLWPQYDIKELWELFNRADATAGGKLHIRYKIKNLAHKEQYYQMV